MIHDKEKEAAVSSSQKKDLLHVVHIIGCAYEKEEEPLSNINNDDNFLSLRHSHNPQPSAAKIVFGISILVLMFFTIVRTILPDLGRSWWEY